VGTPELPQGSQSSPEQRPEGPLGSDDFRFEWPGLATRSGRFVCRSVGYQTDRVGPMNFDLSLQACGLSMPGDPKQCRLNALRCAELAQNAKTQQLKVTLLDLSRDWVKLAESLEMSKAILDEDKVDFKRPA
jgi:hypothetical protein